MYKFIYYLVYHIEVNTKLDFLGTESMLGKIQKF